MGFNGVSGGIVPDFSFHRLKGERFDGADTVDGFNEHTLPFTFCLIKFVQTPLERLDQTGDDQSHKQGVSQHDGGQSRTVKEQKRHKNAQGKNIKNGKEKVS